MHKSLSGTSEILNAFPKLKTDPGFRVDSQSTPDYNCIAWAGKRTKIIWWPCSKEEEIDGVAEWPFGLPRDCRLETFIKLYNKIGFSIVCNDAQHEIGFLKVAIYAKPDPTGTMQLMDRLVTHAARQTLSGMWTSKLGPKQDILHTDPSGLEGSIYGEVVYFLKQPFSQTLETVNEPLKKHKKSTKHKKRKK